MQSELIYSETQRFKQWWLWLILAGINGLFIYGLTKQLITGEPFGDRPMSNIALMSALAFTLVLTLLFLTMRLETQLKEDGIYVRFFPFHLSFRHYRWDKLTKVYIRQYKPLAEYGGWGIRSGITGKGEALNISGNKGLQLEFSDNRKLLIGTKHPENLKEILFSIRQLYPGISFTD